MPASAGIAVGYAQLDDKGRLPVGKPIRQALGLDASSTVAYVIIGETLMVIPQDAHLARIMEAATRALEGAHISIDDLLEELPRAREEVVTEQYGAGFLQSLQRNEQTKQPGKTRS